MPFAGRRRPIAFDTICETAPKAVHPFPDGLPADCHTSFGKQVLNISRAEREAVIDPDRIGDDLAWEAVTFQVGHGGWSAHQKRLDSQEIPNKLAMPLNLMAIARTRKASSVPHLTQGAYWPELEDPSDEPLDHRKRWRLTEAVPLPAFAGSLGPAPPELHPLGSGKATLRQHRHN